MSIEQKRLKLKELSIKRKEAQKEHQKERLPEKEESARSKRKRQEALELLQEQELEQQGIDVDRERNLRYTAEDQERWDEKLKLKEERMDAGFSDFTQIQAKKYSKMVKEIAVDLQGYNAQKEDVDFYRDADNKSYAHPDHKPSKEAIGKLVKAIEEQDKKRKEFSRRRAVKDEQVTYINERNMRYNKKINRAYDKYTKEVKDNFERGTAL